MRRASWAQARPAAHPEHPQLLIQHPAQPLGVVVGHGAPEPAHLCRLGVARGWAMRRGPSHHSQGAPGAKKQRSKASADWHLGCEPEVHRPPAGPASAQRCSTRFPLISHPDACVLTRRMHAQPARPPCAPTRRAVLLVPPALLAGWASRPNPSWSSAGKDAYCGTAVQLAPGFLWHSCPPALLLCRAGDAEQLLGAVGEANRQLDRGRPGAAQGRGWLGPRLGLEEARRVAGALAPARGSTAGGGPSCWRLYCATTITA